MAYESLRASLGGGIVSSKQQAKQSNSATLAIGLGGTGFDCLKVVKKEIFDRIQPDSKTGELPVYDHIEFIEIDTDATDINKQDQVYSINGATEFVPIGTANITALLTNRNQLSNKPYLKWLKAACLLEDGSGISIANASAGAGGVRQIGRLLLFMNIDTIMAKIRNAITRIKLNLEPGAFINIHIFTGLGGGTGSGTFLDVCYLVQYILKEMGLDGTAQVCGYFFLPDVNLAKVKDEKTREYIKSNGYAAMQELDYCMNFDRNGGKWDEVYPGFRYTTDQPPVRMAHLITAATTDGSTRSNGYEYAMHTVAEYVIDYIAEPIVDAHGNKPPTLYASIANTITEVAMIPKDTGAGYIYSVLGASDVYLPYKHITTYIASKVFEYAKRLNQTLPSDHDLEQFLTDNNLTFESLCQQINENSVSVPRNKVDTKVLFSQCESIADSTTMPNCLVNRRDCISEIKDNLEFHAKAMTDGIERTEEGNELVINSLVARINEALMSIAKDSSKGPFYAAALLHSVTAKDIKNRIAGYLTGLNNYRENARADQRLADENINEALTKIHSCGILTLPSSKDKYAEAYSSSWTRFFDLEAEIEVYNALEKVLKKLQDQVEELYNSFYNPLIKVIYDLFDVFYDNAMFYNSLMSRDETDIFASKILSMEELKPLLDEDIESLKMSDITSDFLRMMLAPESCKLWLSQDTVRISNKVSEFFENELAQQIAKTMTSYLAYKYKSEIPAVIIQSIEADILQNLKIKANPLFWMNPGMRLPTPSIKCTCTAPSNESIVCQAVNEFGAQNAMLSRLSEVPDRISMLIIESGVPMFVYAGIEEYANATRVTGAHLHEGAKRPGEPADEDWNSLPLTTPYSCLNNRGNRFDKAIAVYERARELNLIVADLGVLNDNNNSLIIKVFNEDFLNSAIAELNKVIEENDTEKFEVLYNKYNSIELETKTIRIFKDCISHGSEETVFKDYCVASRKLINALENSMNLYDKYKGLLAKIKSIFEEASILNDNLAGFSEAFFSGIIHAMGEFKYATDSGNELDDCAEVLTTLDSEPFGEYLPLYSAFLGYCDLSSGVKQRLKDSVKAKKMEHMDEVRANREKIKSALTIEELKKMNETADHRFKNSLDDVKAFTSYIYKELKML